MNKNDAILAGRILKPKNDMVVLEGSEGNGGILIDLLGHSFAKKLIQISLTATILLSGAGSAYAGSFSVDEAYSIQSIEVTHNNSAGSSYYDGNADGKSKISMLLQGTAEKINFSEGQSESGKYIKNLKKNVDLSFNKQDATSLSLNYDINQSNKLAVNASMLKGMDAQSLDSSFSKIKSIIEDNAIDHLDYINKDFKIGDDSYNDILLGVKEADVASITGDIIHQINKDKKLIQTFNAFLEVNDIDEPDEDKEIMMAIYLIMSNAGDNFTWKSATGAIIDNNDIVTNEINSNIAEHYNLSAKNINDMGELSIYVHETSHYYDHLHGVNKDPRLDGEVTIADGFNFKSSLEAFSDTMAVPVAAAIYAKQNNLDPVTCFNANLDRNIAFRASTLTNYSKSDSGDHISDVHGGAVFATSYMDENRGEMESVVKEIYNKISNNEIQLTFEADIDPILKIVNDRVFSSDAFQKELKEAVYVHTEWDSLGVIVSLADEKNINIEKDILNKLDNLTYRIIDDQKHNTTMQEELLILAQDKINSMQLAPNFSPPAPSPSPYPSPSP